MNKPVTYFGVFYHQVENSDNYEVVVPPEGAVVDGLPDGYSIKKIDGVEYYFLNGTYYAEVDAPKLEGKIGYEVVVIIQSPEIAIQMKQVLLNDQEHSEKISFIRAVGWYFNPYYNITQLFEKIFMDGIML